MYEFLDYQAKDVMTTEVVTVLPSATLGEVEAIFEKNDFNGIPVVNAAGDLEGFMTKLDLLRAFECDDEHVFTPYAETMEKPVSSVMSREIRTVNPRSPLTRVLTRMVDTGCKSLPVLDADDRVVGMIGREDVMRALRESVAGRRPTD